MDLLVEHVMSAQLAGLFRMLSVEIFTKRRESLDVLLRLNENVVLGLVFGIHQTLPELVVGPVE